MLEFRQKRKIRRVIYSPLTIIVLFFVVIVLAKAAWNVYVKETESRTYLTEAQMQFEKISADQSSLSASVAALETPEGVEAAIRSQFLVAKPGEQVAVIVDGDEDNADDAPASGSDVYDSNGAGVNSASSATSTLGFWENIVDFFKF